ncbi:MAG: HNH endonuclease [Chloroflexi bacterium]|nr:HNH endonuclease [Chloroflexota bacterium]
MPLDDNAKEAIKRNAGYRCEYCRMRGWPLTIDHITPRSTWTRALRQGQRPPPFEPDEACNTASACWDCNVIGKSERTSGEDPETGAKVPLFHPRRDTWEEHFEWVEDYNAIRGRSAIGRATVVALGMNLPHYVAQRRLLRAAALLGWEPWP